MGVLVVDDLMEEAVVADLIVEAVVETALIEEVVAVVMEDSAVVILEATISTLKMGAVSTACLDHHRTTSLITISANQAIFQITNMEEHKTAMQDSNHSGTKVA